MCLISAKTRRFLLASVLLGTSVSVWATEFYGDSGNASSWDGEFPPEDYNPYLPESSRPLQRVDQLPFTTTYPASPVFGMPPTTVPQAAPVAPVTPVAPTVPEYYNPQAVPMPSVNPYAPGYSPGLYSPAPSLYPGYFYPFNNSQFIAPYF